MTRSEAQVREGIERARRARPRLRDRHITMAHGAGGRATATLVEALFVPAFDNVELDRLSDAWPRWPVVEALGAAAGDGLRVMRDATRGGVATVLNELAMASDVGVVVAEPPGMVLVRTGIGDHRILDTLIGDPMPRIC